MARSHRRNPIRVARQAGELAVAVPQVIAHRVARMAASGPLPSAVDRHEFTRMGTEKLAAFQESWAAMATQVWWLQQQGAMAMWRALMPWPPFGRSLPAASDWLSNPWWAVVGAGLAPVHLRAVANARRLGRGRRRRHG